MSDRNPEVVIRFQGKPLTPEYLEEFKRLFKEAQRTGRVTVLNDPQEAGALTMLAFIKKYAKAVVAAVGYIASISTALGLTHYHWVSIVLGVLSTIAVIITKNTIPAAKPHAASPAADRG